MTDTETDVSGYKPPSPNPMTLFNPYPAPAHGPNRRLLAAVRSFIGSIPAIDIDTEVDEAPDDGVAWNQGTWRCGSGMCFAGWTGAMTGAKFLYPADASGLEFVDHTELDGDWGLASMAAIVEADGETWHVAEWARAQLNITRKQSGRLFAGGNELGDIDENIIAINREVVHA